MSFNFYLASGNAHKAEEFSELFDLAIIQVLPAPSSVEVVEDGVSFSENALKKAKAYYDQYQRPVMADDSGLNVEALPDELGIHSARFGGEGLDDKQRAELLLKKLEGLEENQRKAYFTCYLCFYLNPDEIFFFEGRLNGTIATQLQGDKGFGYDPVFLPESLERRGQPMSLAQNPSWKQLHSHRAQAVAHAQRFFKERRGQIS